jgi:hypothetical protein
MLVLWEPFQKHRIPHQNAGWELWRGMWARGRGVEWLAGSGLLRVELEPFVDRFEGTVDIGAGLESTLDGADGVKDG